MRINTSLHLTVCAAMLAISPLSHAQNSSTKDILQKKLEEQYAPTKLTADRTNIVTTGAVLTLKKDGLVTVPSATSSDVSGNAYKDGKITQNALGKTNEKAKKIKGVFGRLPLPGGGPAAPVNAPTMDTRTFVAGEKLYVTKIEVKDDISVAFELYSVEAYSDNYYRATLSFPVDKKGSAPTADQVVKTVAEVFTAAPPESEKTANQQGGEGGAKNAPQAAPEAAPPARAAAASFKEDAPPPPVTAAAPPAETAIKDDAPPPPPAPDVKIGSPKNDVLARYGQPDSIGKPAAGKEIYVYKKLDIKVILVNGKVSDIQ